MSSPPRKSTIHRTGGALYVACCGLAYSALPAGDKHTQTDNKVTCGVRKWRIYRTSPGLWVLDDWAGRKQYSASSFPDVIAGFTQLARSSAISLEILRAKLARDDGGELNQVQRGIRAYRELMRPEPNHTFLPSFGPDRKPTGICSFCKRPVRSHVNRSGG